MLQQYFLVLDDSLRADVYSAIQKDFGGNYEDYARKPIQENQILLL